MNTFKKLAYAGAATVMLVEQKIFADWKSLFGTDNATGLDPNWKDANVAIMDVVKALLQFVTLIAVAYALYGGFMILTAGGDDARAKKGRTIIIQVLIGIVVMWLAYAIVSLVVNALA